MDFAAYFEYDNISLIREAFVYAPDQLGKKIRLFSDIKEGPERFDIGLIGVPEERTNKDSGLKDTPDIIRKFLYNLYTPGKISVVDMGNLINTGEMKDTYSALRDVISELICKGVRPVIIGGGMHLNHALYKAIVYDGTECNMTMVSPRVHYTVNRKLKNEEHCFLNQILCEKDHLLYHYSNIGYQEYYNSEADIRGVNELFYDAVRLGHSRNNLLEVEPYLRNSNLIGFDMSSVRYSDAPGFHIASPNGFYGEEICQLANYAGLSDENRIFGVFNVDPDFDINNLTSHLSAQVIWYFIKGHYTQMAYKDSAEQAKNVLKFNVHIDNSDHNIVFYKNKISDKWWMEVPDKKNNSERLIACTRTDYAQACEGELPDRWWKAYQKSN